MPVGTSRIVIYCYLSVLHNVRRLVCYESFKRVKDKNTLGKEDEYVSQF